MSTTNVEQKNELQRMPQPYTVTEIQNISDAFVKSGFFSDSKSVAQAFVKVQAGLEIGIKPFSAMTGIHIILGKPVIGSGVIASRIKASGKYNYLVKELTEKVCSIDFLEYKEFIGNSTFTIDEAKKAGTKNIDKFPKNMLFARAISNGVKFYCPDVFDGPVYVPEEMPEITEDVKHVEVVTSHEQLLQLIEACQTKKDVVDIYRTHQKEFDANNDLKKSAKDKQSSFDKPAMLVQEPATDFQNNL